MFRKTHFRSRPNVYQELTKEFGVYLVRLAVVWKRILTTYPKQIFTFMIVCMMLSGALAFTVMRVKDDVRKSPLVNSGLEVNHGFGEMMDAGQALNKVLNLQNKINTVLHKDSLTASDSLNVKNALRQLEIIHHQLNAKSNH